MDDELAKGSAPLERPPSDKLARAVARARAADKLFASGDVVRLGRYELRDRIASGGMGVVWGAYDPDLGREVAIKLVDAKLAAARERIAGEGQALAKLSHPNVVPIYDVGVVDEEVYLVMERVHGENLRTWLSKPRSVRDVMAVFRAAGEGLAAAHRAGLIHRDFKPENVLVGADGRVRVADFGLARDAAAGDDGSLAGTPAYMAPEQREGGEVGPAADQFAFAVSLWEGLAGERPTLTDGIPNAVPKQRVPLHVQRVLTRGLATRPADRFPSLAALLDALARDPRRRARRIAMIVAALALIGAAIGATAWLSGARDSGWQPSTVELLPAYDEHIGYPEISPDGTQVVFASNHESPRVYRVYLAPLLGGETRAITPPSINAIGASWMRDGRALLVGDRRGEEIHLLKYPLDGSTPEQLGTSFAGAEDCGGGRIIVVHRNVPGCPTCTALMVRESDGTLRELHRSVPGGFVARMTCDRAGRRVVFSAAPIVTAEPPGDVWIINIDGTSPRQLTTDRAYNLAPIFTPDGKSVVFSSMRNGKRNLWELPLDGGAPQQLTFGDGPDIGPALTPDGRTLLYNIDITSWPLVAHVPGAAPRRITGRIDLDAPRATPDGTEVIAEANASAGKQIVAVSVDDGTIRELAIGGKPAVTRDGAHIVYRGEPEHSRLFIVSRKGGTPRELGTAPGAIEQISVDDTHAHLAVATPSAFQSWRIPLAGGAAERDAPAPFFLSSPAPNGGWRSYIGAVSRFEREAILVPPGAALDDPGVRKVRFVRASWTPDGAAVVYFAPPWVRRLDLETGEDRQLFETGDFSVLTAGPNDVVYVVDRLSRVRRMAITNFDARPRP